MTVPGSTIDVLVPALPESVADATVVAWHKTPGERVHADENLVDLETDKVVLEVPAPANGLLKNIVIAVGETVSAQALLARIEVADTPTNQDPTQARPDDNPPSPTAPLPSPPPAQPQRPMAPAARRLIAELKLDPAQIPGSGRDGRIHKADVMAWLDQREADEPEHAADEPAWRASAPALNATTSARDSQQPAQSASPIAEPAAMRAEQRVPMTRLRARIAERLLETQRQTASLTTINDIDMSAVLQLRQRYRDDFEQRHGVRLGIMSFFVKAAVAALQQFPIINAAIDQQDIVYHGYIDIGIAVSTDRGLVVPVLRDCDQLGLAEIELRIAEFGRKAGQGTLKFAELSGGTFSITNGGVFGSLLSTPIINPPQSAILAMHKIEERPIAVEGQVVIRPMMFVALSYDHRLIDGRDAVRFLVGIKNAIEDPARLLLNL